MLDLEGAEGQVRAFTRHVGDVTRLTQPNVFLFLNIAYRQLRTWLQGEAPELYLLTSSDLPVAAGGTVSQSDISPSFEKTFRVDQRLDDGRYRPLEWASMADPNVHCVSGQTVREENGIFRFGSDADFSGVVRVLYYDTPADIAEEDNPDEERFLVPPCLELPLVFLACGLVALGDGDGAAGKKGWDDLAGALMKEAGPQLRARKGVHQERAGLQLIQGY